MRKSILVLVAAVASFVLSFSVQADWQGKLKVSGSGVEQGTGLSEGKISAQGSKIRYEMSAQGRAMAILVDTKAGKATMLMPEQKMAMEMNPDMAGQQLAACSTDDVDGCFKKKGYKSVGKETVAGHPCSILEGTEKAGSTVVHNRVWRPTDLKEVFMLKSVAKMQDGKEVVTEVSEVRMGKLPAAQFAIPGDYKKMQMPSVPGLTE